MASNWKQVKNPWFVVGVGVVGTVAATASFYSAWSSWRLSNATEPSTCTVVDGSVHNDTDSEGTTRGYFPEVTIAHEVDGKRLERVDRGPREISESNARQALDPYPVGRTLKCAYVPGHPELVVLFPKSPTAGWQMAMFGVFLLGLVGGIYAWERRAFGRERSGDKRGASGRSSSDESGLSVGSKRLLIGGTTVASVAILGAFYWTSLPPADAEDEGAETSLRDLALTSTHEDMTRIFGKETRPGAQATFDFTGGAVRRVEINRTLSNLDSISKITLHFHTGFDKAAAYARLQPLVPNRLETTASNYRLHVGDSVMDIGPTTASIYHWGSAHPEGRDYAVCLQRLEAFWAALRFATLDGPPLTPDQLRLVKGPSLVDVVAVDMNVPIDAASKIAIKGLPAGGCSKKPNGLLCNSVVNHPVFTEMRWGWPNAADARLSEVTWVLRKRPDLADVQRAVAECVRAELGDGEEAVVDHLQQRRTWTWRLGESGERAELTTAALVLYAADPPKVGEAPGWAPKIGAISAALDRCHPGE